MQQQESLLQFPCAFTIKAMGIDQEGFERRVVELVRHHYPQLDAQAVTTRSSNGGKYLAVSVTITAESRAQLDAIYQDLSNHPQVLVSL